MKRFKRKRLILIILIGMSLFSFAQTRITGHVFAEIVEAAGATSNTTEKIILQPGQQTSGFDLGEITFSGGSLSACAVIITSDNLMSENGSSYNFSAVTHDGNNSYMLDNSGKQKIRINGSTTDEVLSGGDKNFAAGYAITFAYN